MSTFGTFVNSFTNSETNYYAVLGETNEFDDDEPAKTARSQIQHEISMVGSGVGGGFTDTQELHVMKYKEAMHEYNGDIKRAFVYKALNKLIQGSAADMTKKAMIELYKEDIIPHIQVHDELDISVDGNADKIKNIKESAVELEVPNKVDYESGPNWGTIK